ncbi:MAG: DUF1624 domain-containing protein [Legionella sp.]|nr:DUF1624 domain-containing protein [Legionella sp.]
MLEQTKTKTKTNTEIEIEIKTKSNRILSLDVFRGLTMALMILVNAQGTRTPYALIAHADWHGGTLADLVFPFFLYIVGLTSVIALNRQRDVNKSILYRVILKRSIILFLLGLILNIFPYHFDLIDVRYFGILQRIAVCYFCCSLLYLNTSIKTQFLIFLAILGGYWFIMTQIPVPGFGANQLTQSGNWEAYIDRLLFSTNHLFGKVYDPEGFLSTFPSIATTLLGLLTGSLLLTSLSNRKKLYTLVAVGLTCVVLSWLWNAHFPINKNIWTSSFVLWSGGYAFLVFAVCFYLIDMLGYTSWAWPLKIFGMNALFIFIVHVLLLKIQTMLHFTLKNGKVDNLRVVITDSLFGQFSTQNAGLFYAVGFVFLNFLIALYLYKRRIFIKI